MKLFNKLKNWFVFDRDYYNGSEYDIENIFLELKKEKSKIFSSSKRIDFLIKEGLLLVELQKQKFQLTNEEVNQLIEDAIKKLKK